MSAQPEVIVVDNGSRVLPSEICRQFANVKLVQELTPGPGPARNRGAELSTGRILAFIDADCVAQLDWLNAILKAFVEQPFKIFGGNVRTIFADPMRPTMVESYDSFFAFRQRDYIERSKFSATLNMAVDKEVFKAVGPFGGIEIAEDRDWGQRAARLGYLTRYVPDMIVWHPARRSFADLRAKWNRLTRHNFEEHLRQRRSAVVWLLKSAAVGISPIVDVPRILASSVDSSYRQRALAAVALVYVRIYRARVMFTLLFDPAQRQMKKIWNG
jgi:GT2 family glycosyltransferase